MQNLLRKRSKQSNWLLLQEQEKMQDSVMPETLLVYFLKVLNYMTTLFNKTGNYDCLHCAIAYKLLFSINLC